MKVLQIIECAYRATNEEQDDTIVWLTHAMAAAGADLDVLLTGNAVNYAVSGQDASGLSFGAWKQTQPPAIEREIGRLVQNGLQVFAVADDVEIRGLGPDVLIAGVEPVPAAKLAELVSGYDQVWHW